MARLVPGLRYVHQGSHFFSCLALAGAIHISRSLKLYCLSPLGFSGMNLVEVS